MLEGPLEVEFDDGRYLKGTLKANKPEGELLY